MSTTTGLEVRFTVFYEAQGPILSYCIAPASSFSSNAGIRFASTEQLVEALNAVGLPGREISTICDKTFPVNVEQMQKLGFKLQSAYASTISILTPAASFARLN